MHIGYDIYLKPFLSIMLLGSDKVNELTVKYKNELNHVPFRKMNSVEMDFFFSVCAKIKTMKLLDFLLKN